MRWTLLAVVLVACQAGGTARDEAVGTTRQAAAVPLVSDPIPVGNPSRAPSPGPGAHPRYACFGDECLFVWSWTNADHSVAVRTTAKGVAIDADVIDLGWGEPALVTASSDDFLLVMDTGNIYTAYRFPRSSAASQAITSLGPVPSLSMSGAGDAQGRHLVAMHYSLYLVRPGDDAFPSTPVGFPRTDFEDPSVIPGPDQFLILQRSGGVRFDVNDGLLDPQPIPFQGSPVYDSPSAVFDGASYSIAWSSGADVFAARLPLRGPLLDVEPSSGAPAPVLVGRGGLRAQAFFDGTSVLVTWQVKSDAPFQVFGARVDPRTGQRVVAGTDPELTARSFGFGSAEHPIVAYGTLGGFVLGLDGLVPLERAGAGVPTVGDKGPFTYNGRLQAGPSVASDGQDYLVTWTEEAEGDTARVLAQRFSGSTLRALDSTPLDLGEGEVWGATAAAWTGEQYAVLWPGTPSGRRTVSRDGAVGPVPADLDIDSSPPTHLACLRTECLALAPRYLQVGQAIDAYRLDPSTLEPLSSSPLELDTGAEYIDSLTLLADDDDGRGPAFLVLRRARAPTAMDASLRLTRLPAGASAVPPTITVALPPLDPNAWDVSATMSGARLIVAYFAPALSTIALDARDGRIVSAPVHLRDSGGLMLLVNDGRGPLLTYANENARYGVRLTRDGDHVDTDPFEISAFASPMFRVPAALAAGGNGQSLLVHQVTDYVEQSGALRARFITRVPEDVGVDGGGIPPDAPDASPADAGADAPAMTDSGATPDGAPSPTQDGSVDGSVDSSAGGAAGFDAGAGGTGAVTSDSGSGGRGAGSGSADAGAGGRRVEGGGGRTAGGGAPVAVPASGGADAGTEPATRGHSDSGCACRAAPTRERDRSGRAAPAGIALLVLAMSSWRRRRRS